MNATTSHERDEPAAAADDGADDSASPAALLAGRLSRYVALLAACLAMGGSLFFSEVLGWVPCTLCWYQRILMYPLTAILTVGIVRRDDGLHRYVLPLSVTGACVSLYHYLLIKTTWLPPPPCVGGVPCTVDYLNLFGFVNIPFLALTAFLTITLAMLVSRLAPYEAPADEPPAAELLLGAGALPAYAIIVAAVAAYIAGARLR